MNVSLHKRYAVVMDRTSEVIGVHLKTDGMPPEPRSAGYSVFEVGMSEDVAQGMMRNPDGSYSHRKAA